MNLNADFTIHGNLQDLTALKVDGRVHVHLAYMGKHYDHMFDSFTLADLEQWLRAKEEESA